MIFRIAAFVVVTAAPALAIAEDTFCREPDKRLVDASALYDEGRFSEALEIYATCHEETRRSDFAMNRGLTLMRLGRKAEGATYLHAVATSGQLPAAQAKQVAALLGNLEKELSRLQIRAEEGVVVIDGRQLGNETVKLVQFLEPGAHTVELRGVGQEPEIESINLVAGELRRLELRFSSEGDAPDSEPPIDDEPPPAGEVHAPAKRRSLSLSLLARVDAAPLDNGAVAAIGAAKYLGSRARLGLHGLVGARPGAELEGTFYAYRGRRVRLFVAAATPTFVEAGDVFPGARGAAGAGWDFDVVAFEISFGISYALRRAPGFQRATELVSLTVERLL